ncbi:unnamed protein product [Trichogramma brassicae]|uniref:poly(A)-specific ribonuclease n=1 Tax=Trichogramma brassicae TaxID=86971 RepID=A0A6H5I590_9HYME|nr:unnamed protein product [Trichogramma brassicae]
MQMILRAPPAASGRPGGNTSPIKRKAHKEITQEGHQELKKDREQRKIILKQSEYIQRILERFDMAESKPQDSPMVTRQYRVYVWMIHVISHICQCSVSTSIRVCHCTGSTQVTAYKPHNCLAFAQVKGPEGQGKTLYQCTVYQWIRTGGTPVAKNPPETAEPVFGGKSTYRLRCLGRVFRYSKQNITEVWSSNLIQAFKDIKDQIKNTSYVAFDSEYPGHILPRTRVNDEWTYIDGTVRRTNPIQFGLAFYGEFGNKIIPINTWQINFKFDEDADEKNPDGIKFLKEHGFDFDRHKNEGVSHEEFRKLLVDTGIFGSNKITWVTFYGNFDIAYLLKSCVRIDGLIMPRVF